MVSAWCDKNDLVLGQVQTQGKSNEITAIPELLQFLKIPGCIVTIDAIGCQREIVKRIKKEKAEYCISLKGNHPTLYEELTTYAQDCLNDPLLKDRYSCYKTQEKGHGRIERRTYTFFQDLSWLQDRSKWCSLAALVRVDPKRTVGANAPTYETRYYITSLTCVQEAARAIRAHWGVENKLHWILDFVFREDDWPTRKAIAAANLALIRKFALAFLRNVQIPNNGTLLAISKCGLVPLIPLCLSSLSLGIRFHEQALLQAHSLLAQPAVNVYAMNNPACGRVFKCCRFSVQVFSVSLFKSAGMHSYRTEGKRESVLVA